MNPRQTAEGLGFGVQFCLLCEGSQRLWSGKSSMGDFFSRPCAWFKTFPKRWNACRYESCGLENLGSLACC